MTEPAWKSLPLPEINSRWDSPRNGGTRTVRVMGVVEGYVVARYSGCMPFLIHMSDWHLRFEPKIMPKRQRRGIEVPRPFYGAECPSYPNCEGGCGLGCTKEIERSKAPVGGSRND